MEQEVIDNSASIFNVQPIKEEPKVESTEIEASVEAEATPAVTETTNEPEPEVKPWYEELEFPDENSAKEFVKRYKNFQPEVPAPKYASSNVEKYNKFVEATGIDDYNTYNLVSSHASIENPTQDQIIDTVIAKMIYEDPELKGDEAYLKERLKKDYKLDVELEFADDDEKFDVKQKKRELNKKFEESKNFFNEISKKLETQPVDNSKLEENQRHWESEILKDKEGEFKIDLPVLKKNEKGELIDTGEIEKSIIFDKPMYDAYVRNYKAILNGRGWPEVDSGLAQEAKGFAATLVLAENIHKIYSDAVSHGYSKAVKEYHIEVENPSAAGTHKKIADTNTVTDKSGGIFSR